MKDALLFDTTYCDTTYDNQLFNIDGINRLPWVGFDYKNQKVKTLVLGESVYDWKPTDPHSIEKIYDSNSLRIIHKSYALDFKSNIKFVRNIERAIFSKIKPTDEEKSLLWNSVVYHNLVSKVLKTKNHRPSYDDYYAGWGVFDKIISIFEVKQVIVYGLEGIKIKAFQEYCRNNDIYFAHKNKIDKVGRSRPIRYIIEKNGINIDILFIRHPSSYFSWKKWAGVIRSEIKIPGQLA